MRRYGLPSARGGWTRMVALLMVVAMVASLGYLTLLTVQAPIWLTLALVALLVGLPIALLARREDRSS